MCKDTKEQNGKATTNLRSETSHKYKLGICKGNQSIYGRVAIQPIKEKGSNLDGADHRKDAVLSRRR